MNSGVLKVHNGFSGSNMSILVQKLIESKKYKIFNKKNYFGNFGPFKDSFGKLGLAKRLLLAYLKTQGPCKGTNAIGAHDLAGDYWGVIIVS